MKVALLILMLTFLHIKIWFSTYSRAFKIRSIGLCDILFEDKLCLIVE